MFVSVVASSNIGTVDSGRITTVNVTSSSCTNSRAYGQLVDTVRRIFKAGCFLPTRRNHTYRGVLTRAFIGPKRFALVGFRFAAAGTRVAHVKNDIVRLIHPRNLRPGDASPFGNGFSVPHVGRVVGRLNTGGVTFMHVRTNAGLVNKRPIDLRGVLRMTRVYGRGNVVDVLSTSLLRSGLCFVGAHRTVYGSVDVGRVVRGLNGIVSIVCFSTHGLDFSHNKTVVSGGRSCVLGVGRFVPLCRNFLACNNVRIHSVRTVTMNLHRALSVRCVYRNPRFVRCLIGRLSGCNVPMMGPTNKLNTRVSTHTVLPRVPRNRCPTTTLTATLCVTDNIHNVRHNALSRRQGPSKSRHCTSVRLIHLTVPHHMFALSRMGCYTSHMG